MHRFHRIVKDASKARRIIYLYSPRLPRSRCGTRLMEHILEMAKADTMIHNVVSVITAGNEGSTKLHNRFGFTYCGLTPEVGFKHGKYQDTENLRIIGIIIDIKSFIYSWGCGLYVTHRQGLSKL